MVGKTISHYQVLEKLGEGGMGIVYKARDIHLDRFVAIKVLPPEKLADPERKARFVQEAKAASTLNHPNIIVVHDIDQRDGIDVIVMEYVQGKTLDQLIGRKGLSLKETLHCGIQAADALAKAHASGIIHRDLKPSNLMVRGDGLLKILDFGLAKLTEAGQPCEDEATLTMRPTTEEGKIVGTVSYMSPEQAEGRQLDARSDIFSFGSVLYEMVTGRKAFQGDSRVSTLAALLKDDPKPASQIAPDLPAELERIIRRCLRKDPAHRFQTMADLKVALEELEEESESGKLTAVEVPARLGKRFLWSVAAVAVVIVLVVAGFFVWQRMQAKPLTDRDVLVLADFTNTTGEPVFDTTLREALAVQLEQSPFLKILGDEQMRQNLRSMGRPAGERISNQIAREVCQREGEKAMIGGSIVRLGKTYAITLQATNCRTGEALAREQVEAEDKEHVLRAVATATGRMRAKLGESLGSIQKLAVPSEQVTTTSLEAFQAYALGRAQVFSGSFLTAIPLFLRATELDPNFASAYRSLGAMYWNVGETGRAAEYVKQAFGLVSRVSERERLSISAEYHRIVTGEMNKTIDAYQLYARTYPREFVPHNNLGVVYTRVGDPDKALPEYQEASRLEPRSTAPYSSQVFAYASLGRFDEAKAIAEKAFAQNLDPPSIHQAFLRIAFVRGDRAEAQKQIQWLAGRPEEYLSLGLQATDAAHLGQFRRAEELFERAVDMARRRNLIETAARFQAEAALEAALVGKCQGVRDRARAAILPQQAPSDTAQAALPLALCGDAATAHEAEEGTSRQYPVHTIWNAVESPSIRAAIELSHNQPEKAVELLRSAAPYERAYPSAIYLRGLAYLRSRKGPEAAAEFQKILDHRGANWGPYYPLSFVGLARAAVLAADTARARTSYQDFLALWKDADADIPILREVRQEYAKRQ